MSSIRASAFLERGGRRCGGGAIRLVVDPRRHLTESTLVLVEVVGAEQEVEAGIQGGADISLGTTPVTPVRCGERTCGSRCAHVVTSLCCDTLSRVPHGSGSRTQITTETQNA